jgi:hypothetical protein
MQNKSNEGESGGQPKAGFECSVRSSEADSSPPASVYKRPFGRAKTRAGHSRKFQQQRQEQIPHAASCAPHGCATAGFGMTAFFKLAFDADLGEVEDDAAAGHGTTES